MSASRASRLAITPVCSGRCGTPASACAGLSSPVGVVAPGIARKRAAQNASPCASSATAAELLSPAVRVRTAWPTRMTPWVAPAAGHLLSAEVLARGCPDLVGDPCPALAEPAHRLGQRERARSDAEKKGPSSHAATASTRSAASPPCGARRRHRSWDSYGISSRAGPLPWVLRLVVRERQPCYATLLAWQGGGMVETGAATGPPPGRGSPVQHWAGAATGPRGSGRRPWGWGPRRRPPCAWRRRWTRRGSRWRPR